jgi:hypothetical protein
MGAEEGAPDLISRKFVNKTAIKVDFYPPPIEPMTMNTWVAFNLSIWFFFTM